MTSHEYEGYDNKQTKILQYNAAKMDFRDIINKLNEVGLECPTFVAKSVAKLPLATTEAFNMANISKDITNILRLE